MPSPSPFTIRQRFIKFLAAGAAISMVLGAAEAQTVSLSLSDNLVVLNDKQRSAVLELVNLGDDLLEFNLTASEQASGKLKDGASIVRWAPERALVQPHRAVPMRVSSRTTPEMPPGEYVFKAYVKVTPHEAERRAPTTEKPGEAQDSSLSISVGVSPSLPITVYTRHKIAPNMLDAGAFVLTPEDSKYIGYFPVVKRVPLQSFVGRVQAIDKPTSAVLNEGRLHLPPSADKTDTSNVRILRTEQNSKAQGPYCLRIWDQFPSEGPPVQEFC